MCIIGVSGKARSGKNTFADMLAEELHKQIGVAYVMMAYADVLKKMAQNELDLSWDQLWGESKEAEDKRYIKKVNTDSDGEWLTYWTGREIMQSLGEFYRAIDGLFWVKKLFRTIDEKEYQSVIITDVRYPNEVDPVVERGGYHVRVNRPEADEVHGTTHASETSLDAPYKVDFTIMNTGTLDDLRKSASYIVSGITQLEKLRR